MWCKALACKVDSLWKDTFLRWLHSGSKLHWLVRLHRLKFVLCFTLHGHDHGTRVPLDNRTSTQKHCLLSSFIDFFPVSSPSDGEWLCPEVLQHLLHINWTSIHVCITSMILPRLKTWLDTWSPLGIERLLGTSLMAMRCQGQIL